MADIYYSKRSGAETERILDKAKEIKINDQNTEGILLNNIKIGNAIYKPNVVKKKYVYIHVVELYFYWDLSFEGELKTLITIDDRSQPYVEGTEYLFFKSFGGGTFLTNFGYGWDILSGSYYCTENGGKANGTFLAYYQSTNYKYPFTAFTATARINNDTIYRLEMEEL